MTHKDSRNTAPTSATARPVPAGRVFFLRFGGGVVIVGRLVAEMVVSGSVRLVRSRDHQKGPRDLAKVVFAVLRGETLSGAADGRSAYTWGLSGDSSGHSGLRRS